MKVLSVKRTVSFYIVTDLPWDVYGKRLQKIRDVRLYEVSPSMSPIGNVVGMLVAGRDREAAINNLSDILASYSVIVP